MLLVAVFQTRWGWMLLLGLSVIAGCCGILGWWGARVHRVLVVSEGLCMRGWTLALHMLAHLHV